MNFAIYVIVFLLIIFGAIFYALSSKSEKINIQKIIAFLKKKLDYLFESEPDPKDSETKQKKNVPRKDEGDVLKEKDDSNVILDDDTTLSYDPSNDLNNN